MKNLKRNESTIYYCLFNRIEAKLDEIGYETSEMEVIFDEPVELKCNVSASKGASQSNPFGNYESYDKIIIVDDINCPIDENSVLFVDKEPEYSEGKAKYDYIVKLKAKSINSIAYAIAKVKVS